MEDRETTEIESFESSDRRGATFGKDWTKGSIFRNLLLLSWPMTVSEFLNMIGPTIDLIWVGKLGAAPIAGVGVAGMVVMLMTSGVMGLAMGARAVVARFVGAGDAKGANHAAQQAFITAVFFVALVVTIGVVFAEPILILMGVEPEVVAEGAAYMRIMFVGSGAMTFRMLAEGIMQASGDAVTPMRISIFFRVFHTVLCPFLVFGWFIFPRLGASGAALTNVFAQGLGLFLAVWILFSGRTRLRLTLANLRFDAKMIWRIVRLGLPAAASRMQRGGGQVILVMLMIPFGTNAVAAHTILQRVEMVFLTLTAGLGLGSGVLAGQNLGAAQPERAEKGGWQALGIAEVITVIGSGAILLWAEPVVRIFNSDPALVELTSSFLRIAAAGLFLLGFVVVFQLLLTGSGDPVPAMIIEIAHMWMFILPMSVILSKYTDLGMYGIRWAMAFGVILGAAAYLWYFRTGKWKHRKV